MGLLKKNTKENKKIQDEQASATQDKLMIRQLRDSIIKKIDDSKSTELAKKAALIIKNWIK